MTKILNPNLNSDLHEAVDILKKGGVVALPTETVYGLAADASNENGIRKIFYAKRRPANHPLILHINSFDNLNKYVTNIPLCVEILAKKFWPGPLTILLSKSSFVSDLVTGGSDKVAIRVPSNKFFQKVLEMGDFGIVAPSANLHKKLSPTKSEHVFRQLNGSIDAILDGGSCKIGIESTIVDCTSENLKILRSGPILKNDLEMLLNIEIEDVSSSNHNNVSGSMKEHYKPNKYVYIFDKNSIKNIIDNKKSTIIFYSDYIDESVKDFKKIRMSKDPLEYGRLIYSALYEADIDDSEIILIEDLPKNEEWLAINDRIRRML